MFIYAHRGASADYPEMTEAAYRGAIAQGADGFECDLRLSRDEVPVLWHNASMHRHDGYTVLFAEMKYVNIKRAYPQILTLDEFLDIALEAKKSVLIETKHPVISGNRVEEIAIATIRDRKIIEKIHLSLMSFSWSAIEKVHRIAPEVHTTFLTSYRTLWPQVRFSSANAIGPGINEVRNRPELIAKIRKLGKEASVWTVDNGADIELCKELGVDNLITNTPAHARTFL
jgi:glycerophosphoryl diester phosphodiesterase